MIYASGACGDIRNLTVAVIYIAVPATVKDS